MRGCSGSVCQRALLATLARRRRTDDVHRFILVGQALWAGIVPTWFISRASGDRPAQGFRGRPRLARLVADVFDLGAARTAPQDDFGPMADQHHGETLPRIRPYVASPSGTRGSLRDAAPAGLLLRRPACRTPPRPSRRRRPVQMIAGVPPNQTGSLIIVISIKYAILTMRADNHGEGGILALLALVSPRRAKQSRRRAVIVVIGLVGATLLYGDGTITPAISVLSALEGLKVYTPQMGRLVVPLTVLILVLLFLIQLRGTSWIGGIFGPVMLIWFIVI